MQREQGGTKWISSLCFLCFDKLVLVTSDSVDDEISVSGDVCVH